MPTCPDCILAARRTAEPTPKTAPPATAAIAAPEPPVETDVVERRDAAVRSALKLRPWQFDALLSVLPDEQPPLTLQGKREALSRCLSRLKLKTREVKQSGELWMLSNV